MGITYYKRSPKPNSASKGTITYKNTEQVSKDTSKQLPIIGHQEISTGSIPGDIAANTARGILEDVAITPAAHFVNQLGLNIPRAAAALGNYSYPESNTAAGNILSKGAGVLGGLENPLVKGLLGATTMAGKGVRSALGIAKPEATNLLGRLGTAAGQGAVLGGAYTPTEHPFNPMERVPGAIVGGLLGPAAEIAIPAAKFSTREARKFITKLKRPGKTGAEVKLPGERAVSSGGLSAEKRNALLAKRAAQETQQKINPLESEQQRAADIQQRLADTATLRQQATKEAIAGEQQTTADKLAQMKAESAARLEKANQDVDRIAQTKLQEAKPLAQKFSRENSQAYKNHLDAISSEVDARSGGISKSQVNDIINQAEQEASPDLIDTGVYAKLKAKYGIKPSENQPQLFEMPNAKTNPNFSFKEVLKDFKDLSRQEASAASKGAKMEYKPDDDIALAILQDKFGDFATQHVPEFGELQANYKPIVQGMKTIRNIIKPGAMYDVSGAGALKAGVTGENIGNQQVLKLLEQGNPKFAPGIGPVISNPINEAINAAQGIKTGAIEAQQGLQSQSQGLQRALEEESQRRLSDLYNRQAKVGSVSKGLETQKQSLQEALKGRQQQLSARTAEIQKKQVPRNVARYLRNAATLGGAIPLADYLVRRKLGNILYQGNK